MKRIKICAIVFLQLIFMGVSKGQIWTLHVQNLNGSGPGSLEYMVDSLADAPFVAICSIQIQEDLSGEITLTKPLRVQNMDIFTFFGNPNVDIKFSGVDTAIIAHNIDIFSIMDVKSSSNTIISSYRIDIVSITDSETKWLNYFTDIDIVSVEYGESKGVKTNRVSDVRLTGHSVNNANYLVDIEDTRVHDSQWRRVVLKDNKIGLIVNDQAYPVKFWGAKIANCQNTEFEIIGNEFLSTGNSGSGKSNGAGLYLENCSGSVNIKGNYFGTDSTLSMLSSIGADAICLDNVGVGVGYSGLNIDSNFFQIANASAIQLNSVNDTMQITRNKFSFTSTAATLSNAITFENSSNISFVSNEIGKSFKNAIALNKSNGNYIANNLIGLIDDGQTNLLSYPSLGSGVYVDSVSNHNIITGNYIVGHGKYGIENHGTNNDIAYNYVSCNDSGNYYNDLEKLIYQEEIGNVDVVFNVSPEGEGISLNISNLSLPDGFIAHVYKKGQCFDYTRENLVGLYIGSVAVNNGAVNFNFLTTPSTNKILSDEEESEYYVVLLDQNNNFIGESKSSEVNIVLGTNQPLLKRGTAYPNPAISFITVEGELGFVYNSIGSSEVFVQNGKLVSFDLASGVYMLQYNDGRHERIIIK